MKAKLANAIKAINEIEEVSMLEGLVEYCNRRKAFIIAEKDFNASKAYYDEGVESINQRFGLVKTTNERERTNKVSRKTR